MALRDYLPWGKKPTQERRDPRKITADSGGGAYVHTYPAPPRRDSVGLLETALTNPTFESAIRVRAEALASVPFILYRMRSRNEVLPRLSRIRNTLEREGVPQFESHTRALEVLQQEEMVEKVDFDHPLLELLRKPNPLMTGRAFWILWSKYVDINGEAFVIRDGPEDRPTSMWVYPSHWCTETATYEKPVFKFCRGPWHEPLPIDRVWWVKNHNPCDPFGRGVGMATAIADELETAEYAAVAVKARMANRGLPDYVVNYELPPGVKLSPEDKRDLAQQLDSRFKSVHGRGRFVVGSNNISITPISHTMTEMGALELREQLRDFILSHTGVPRELLSLTADGNRATAESALQRLYMTCTLPVCEFRRTELQENIVNNWDSSLILSHESPVQDDRQFKLDVMRSRPDAYTQQEWRDLSGHPRIVL